MAIRAPRVPRGFSESRQWMVDGESWCLFLEWEGSTLDRQRLNLHIEGAGGAQPTLYPKT